MVYKRNSIKMDDLGVPPLVETPIITVVYMIVDVAIHVDAHAIYNP